MIEELEAEVGLLLLLRTPPTGLNGGEVLSVAFFARRIKASRVLPVVGALIAPTIPDWQWLPLAWPQ